MSSKVNDEALIINQEKESLIIKEDNTHTHSQSHTEYEDDISDHSKKGDTVKDPFDFHKLSFPTDYYSITWISLKKSQFIGASLHGIDIFLIPSDYFWIYINFLSFAIFVLITIILLVKEALLDDIFLEADWKMTTLRVIIVAFAQRKLVPEFIAGYRKLLYSLRNHREFTHPEFASFVGICQMFVATANLCAIIAFVCMADEYIDPVANFGGICALSEFDDWVGDAIMTYKLKGMESLPKEERERIFIEKTSEKGHEVNPYEIHNHEKKSDVFKVKDLNSKLPLVYKLAFINEDDLEIEVDESLYVDTHWIIVKLERVVKIIPWEFIIPLLTIPLGIYLPILTKYIRN